MADAKAKVALVGFLDTKGAEHVFVKQVLESRGCEVVVIDVSITTGYAHAEIATHSPAEVCAAAGKEISVEDLVTMSRGDALDLLTEGATQIMLQLLEDAPLRGALGIGGSTSSALACAVMRHLPLGFPKMCVSTMVSGDVSAYVGDTDICLMPSIVDISGTLNAFSERVLRNAAAALAGMVRAYTASSSATRKTGGSRKRVALTMFGVTTPAVNLACEKLAEFKDEKSGESIYEPVVFHCTGSGGRAMERLISEKWFDAVFDLTTTELVDEHCGGVLSAGSVRLTSAGKLAIPQVVSLGALDMCNFGPRSTVPEKFKGRKLHEHNSTVTLMRTAAEEAKVIGRTVATRLSAAKGPVAVFVPTQGLSMLDAEGGPFWDPEVDGTLVEAIKTGLKDTRVEVVDIQGGINDEALVDAMVTKLHMFLS